MDIIHHCSRAALLGLAGILMLGCDSSTGSITGLATGAIQVTVITTGADVDPNGYALSITNAPNLGIGINGTVTIGPLAKATYRLELLDVAPNCTVSGGNPRSIDLGDPASASPVAVTFYVSCVQTDSGAGDGASPWDY